MRLTGYTTALITPLCNNRIDHRAFVQLIETQIEQGISGIVAGGTTGEATSLTKSELAGLFDLAADTANGRVPVIAGCGAPSTAAAIELSLEAQRAKVDALLHVTPYYTRPSQEGLFQHFKAIHDATDLPIILYDVPGRTGVTISDDLLYRLADLPRITGLKDCTNNTGRIRKINSRFNVLSGNDDTALEYMQNGADGCISVTSNIVPDLCASMYKAHASGDITTARNIDASLQPLHTAMFADASPAPVKFAASQLGLARNELRLPHVSTNSQVEAQVLRALGVARPLRSLNVA